MASYYNPSGGCVHPQSPVVTATGDVIEAAKVRKGDRLMPYGARVRCVVRIRPADGSRISMCRLEKSGLVITPYHPIRRHRNMRQGLAEKGAGDDTEVNGGDSCWEWVFPCEQPDAVMMATGIEETMEEVGEQSMPKWNAPAATTEQRSRLTCEEVITWVLEDSHVVIVCGEEVATLGHGFTDSAVIAHEFLGTEKVVKALQGLPGFEEGEVVVGGFQRDIASMRIIGVVA